MHPQPIFLNVNLYGIMIAIGLLVGFTTFFIFSKKKRIDPSFTDFVFYNATFCVIVGFLSAAFFQALYNYIDDPKSGFKFGNGITFLGGLFGVIVTFLTIYFIFRPKLKGRLIQNISILPCCILVGHAFGRLGCLFAGCCHGKYLGTSPTPGGIKMDGTYGWGYYVPVQLYEAIFLFALFIICSFLLVKYDFKHNLSIYLSGYGAFRFIIEFFREDERGKFIGNISPSQFWSLLMVIAGIVLIFCMQPVFKKQKLLEQTNKTTLEE